MYKIMNFILIPLLDAALRLIVRDSDEFLFRVQPGDLIHANMAGKVIASNNPEYKVGEFVNGSLGVQNFAISDGNDLEKCDIDLAPLGSWLGGFGVSGLTAYFALFDECKPQPGQTVLVTGAAGAVGSMAGQLAKLAGARVIGTTSSTDKLVEHLSTSFTLEPGDLILSGTPGGVGVADNKFLKEGDEVKISISELGYIENKVVNEPLSTIAY